MVNGQYLQLERLEGRTVEISDRTKSTTGCFVIIKMIKTIIYIQEGGDYAMSTSQMVTRGGIFSSCRTIISINESPDLP